MGYGRVMSCSTTSSEYMWRNVTTVSDGVSISSSEYEIGLGIILGG